MTKNSVFLIKSQKCKEGQHSKKISADIRKESHAKK